MTIFRAVLLLLSAVLAACSTGPQPVPASAPEAAVPAAGTATTPLPPRSAGTAGGDAVAALVADAAAACTAGDVATGLARLDRGLRIAPQSAAIYLEMARCHVIAGDEVRGAAAAERGLAYCSAEQCRRLRAYLQD